MAYANILTLYTEGEDALKNCAQIISSNNSQFVVFGNTFFISSPGKQHVNAILNSLKATKYVYTFLFFDNLDGSAFRSNGVEQDTVNAITSILQLLTS